LLRMQAIEVFKLLPAASSYAQHRLKVMHQALALLDKDRQAGHALPLLLLLLLYGSHRAIRGMYCRGRRGARTADESDELQQLLQQLKI
jgi:hypothetical protein